ncbi:MAG: hypothetical protein K0S96_1736 [Geminicoccaceae bacterium]|nr:hypothetical protein [Geminicoccaceae bacterium]
MGQHLLLERASLGDVLRSAENADHQFAGFVPLRPPGIAQPVTGAVAALDAVLGARLLASDEFLRTKLHEAQIRGLDQGRPAAQRLDLGRAVSGQALERAGGPVQDQAAVRVDAQMVDGVGAESGERVEPALQPLRGLDHRALGGHIAQIQKVRPALADHRSTLNLSPQGAPCGSCDLQRELDRAAPLDGLDQTGEFQGVGDRRRQGAQRLAQHRLGFAADQPSEAGVGVDDRGRRPLRVARGHDDDRITNELDDLCRQIGLLLSWQSRSARPRRSPLCAQAYRFAPACQPLRAELLRVGHRRRGLGEEELRRT